MLLDAVPAARNLKELLVVVGLAPYGGNYEVMRERLRALGVADARFQPRGRVVRISDARLAEAVAESDSWAMAARRLGLDTNAGQRRVKSLAEKMGLDSSHFLGQGWNRGAHGRGRAPEPLETVLVEGRRISTSKLRARLIKEGIMKPACASCGLDRWQDRPIPLELDHVNGYRNDNRLENLRLLCPNCHAQTETYRGRNIGTAAARPAARPVALAVDGAEVAERAARRLVVVLGRPAA